VSGGFGVQRSVAPTRGEELEQLVSGCEGSPVIFPARFLTLEMYKSSMEGRLEGIVIAHPWGVLVLVVRVLGLIFPSLQWCVLSDSWRLALGSTC